MPYRPQERFRRRRLVPPGELPGDAERQAYVDVLRSEAEFAATSTWPAVGGAFALVGAGFALTDGFAVLWTIGAALVLLLFGAWASLTKYLRFVEAAEAQQALDAYKQAQAVAQHDAGAGSSAHLAP